MFSSAHCSPAGHVPGQAMMPHCPHVGVGPVQSHNPVPPSTTHVCPFKHTPLEGQKAAPTVHMRSVVVVVLVGHDVVTVKVVMVVVLVVVEVVVVMVGPHGGSAGFVQEQNVSPLILHCSRTDCLQALKSAPDKAPHAAVISSEHCFEPQSGGAALGPETKTPAASATANNVTAAFLVIVAPSPYGPFPCARSMWVRDRCG